jgi:hypothetical protein
LEEIVTTDVPPAAMTFADECVLLCSVVETEFAPPPKAVLPILVVAVHDPDRQSLSTRVIV